MRAQLFHAMPHLIFVCAALLVTHRHSVLVPSCVFSCYPTALHEWFRFLMMTALLGKLPSCHHVCLAATRYADGMEKNNTFWVSRLALRDALDTLASSLLLIFRRRLFKNSRG